MDVKKSTGNQVEKKSLSTDQLATSSGNLQGRCIKMNNGVLIISGVEHTVNEENIPVIRRAIRLLPAPIRTIQRDFNNLIYDSAYHPDYEKGYKAILITIKNGKQKAHSHLSADTNATYLSGNDGHKFLTFPRPRTFRLIPKDDTARYISQGRIGYSEPGNGKLGTDNVQDCVALVIQDILTKKMALAHVSTQSHYLVDEALQTLPKGEKKIILIGARYSDNTYNVDGILEKLGTYPDKFHINESYIFDDDCLVSNGPVNNDPLPYDFISCYEINTNFGTVMVDPDTLEITTAKAENYSKVI